MEKQVEIIETIMFEYWPEWGQRIIKADPGHITLESTSNGGETWEPVVRNFFTGTIVL